MSDDRNDKAKSKVLASLKVKDGHYILKRKGLYFDDGKNRKRVSAYIRPLADVIEPDGARMRRRLEFKTKDGHIKSLDVRRSALLTPRELIEAIVERGFDVTTRPDDWKRIAEFVTRLPCSHHVRQLALAGWHELRHNGKLVRYFVLGNEVIGPKIDGFAVESDMAC